MIKNTFMVKTERVIMKTQKIPKTQKCITRVIAGLAS